MPDTRLLERAEKSMVGDTDPTPLGAFIVEQQHKLAPDASGRLTLLLNSIGVACKCACCARYARGLGDLRSAAPSLTNAFDAANEVFLA